MRRPTLLERARSYRDRYRRLARLVGSSASAIAAAWGEADRHLPVFEELRQALRGAPPSRLAALGASLTGVSWAERLVTRGGPSVANRELYTLVRAIRPAVVVETGVASGISTAFILAALERNGEGKLWSIDLPNYRDGGYVNADGKREQVQLAEGQRPGWVIPDRLRARWSLSEGRSSELLPGLVASLPPIGLFFHDSEHSAETMLMEYRTVWPRLAPGGVLYSDDVIWNDAFDRFATSVGRPAEPTPSGRGAIRRELG